MRQQSQPTRGDVLIMVRRMLTDGTARQIRQSAPLSIDELARELGISRQTLYQWEGRLRTPRDTRDTQLYGTWLMKASQITDSYEEST